MAGELIARSGLGRAGLTRFLEWLGNFFIDIFEEIGIWFQMLGRTFAWTFRPPFEFHEWLRQMVRVGVDSIPVVFLTTMFTGMVMALQTFNGFQRVHAENFVGSVARLLRSVTPYCNRSIS